MKLYGEKNLHQTTRTSVFVGISYAITIVLSLLLCVSFYDRATYDTFGNLSIFAGLLSFIFFSNQRYFTIDNSVLTLHRIGTLIRLWLLIFVAVIAVNYFTKSVQQFSRVVMISWLILTPCLLLIVSMLCRYIVYKLYSSTSLKRVAVFICINDDAEILVERLQQAQMMGIECAGYFDDDLNQTIHGLPCLGKLSDVITWTKSNHTDIVFISLMNTHQSGFSTVITELQDSAISIYFIPDSTLFGLRQLQQGDIAGVPVLIAYETPFIGLTLFLKRCFDVAFSALILLLLSPVFLMVAIGVKLSSPGPVFFRQKRYGIGGVQIDVYKFRSMRIDANVDNKDYVQQASKGDPRITKFGQFIRKTSLDELPQFWNVLKGSMSIVGPRPHAVQHNELYRKQIRGYMMRYQVKPGITGWAQVNGYRGETNTLDKMEKRIEYDLFYIKNWSLELDLKIIIKTVLLVFKDNHAY